MKKLLALLLALALTFSLASCLAIGDSLGDALGSDSGSGDGDGTAGDGDGDGTGSGGADQEIKKEVYWDETELIFEINENSVFGELYTSGRRLYAGDVEDRSATIDRLVAERNGAAEAFAKVKVRYKYLPDAGGEYSYANNVLRIRTETATYTPGESTDIYSNFTYDLTCAALGGSLANLKTASYGEGNNFYPFFGDAEDAEGYYYDYMKSITLSDDKMYLIASEYTSDFVRSLLVIPVNLSLMNSIPEDKLPTERLEKNAEESNYAHFQRLVYSGNWDYAALAKYSNAVFVDSNTENTAQNGTANYGDVLGFAFNGESSVPAMGLLYSSGVNILNRVAREGESGKYDFLYPETNGALVAFADALAKLVSENASGGICEVTKADTGATTSYLGLRSEFVSSKILFGSISRLGWLDDESYSEMKANGSLGIAPIPDHNIDDGIAPNTVAATCAHMLAVAARTDKFEQCSAYLNYQSQNSSDVLREYYSSSFDTVKEGESTVGNTDMLFFIDSRVDKGLDLLVEELTRYHLTPTDPRPVYRHWDTYLRAHGLVAPDMEGQYSDLRGGKEWDMQFILESWERLPVER